MAARHLAPPKPYQQRWLATRRGLPTTSWLAAVAFLAPALVLLVAFKYVPLWEAATTSTKAYSVAGIALGSVGLDNYRAVLTDPSFQNALSLTLLFAAVKIPLQLLIGLSIALLVWRPGRLNSFVRTAVFLPTVTAIVVVGVIFTFLFDREIGLVNTVLMALGGAKVGWLLTPRFAQFVVLVLSLWRDAGFVVLVFVGGLQGIPESLLEAARLEGASAWQSLRYVTVPLLIRSFQFASVFTTVAAFQLFAPIFVMTQGGPDGATDVAAFHIYQTAFVFFDLGSASAMSIIVVVLLILVTGIELWLLRPRWAYS